MKKKKIKRIGVYTFAKLHAVFMSLVGLFAGILYSVGGLVIDTFVSLGWLTSTETPGLSYGTILAFGALIGMPLLFAAAGFLLGLLESIFFNLFAAKFGGLSVDFE